MGQGQTRKPTHRDKSPHLVPAAIVLVHAAGQHGAHQEGHPDPLRVGEVLGEHGPEHERREDNLEDAEELEVGRGDVLQHQHRVGVLHCVHDGRHQVRQRLGQVEHVLRMGWDGGRCRRLSWLIRGHASSKDEERGERGRREVKESKGHGRVLRLRQTRMKYGGPHIPGLRRAQPHVME